MVNVDTFLTSRYSAWVDMLMRRKKPMRHGTRGQGILREYLGGTGYIGYLVEKHMKMDTFISVSSHNQPSAAAGVRKEIQTVMNGIDPEPIFSSPRRGEPLDVVYAGRLINHKNVDLLIEAVGKVKGARPGIKCMIIGEGPEKLELEELVKSLGLEENVRFEDFLANQSELFGIIKASKMLVLPSVREGFGWIVAEANACNVPVITTSHEDNGARDLIIEGENGYLTQVDADHLAGRMHRVLNDSNTLTPLMTFRREFGDLNWNRAGDDFDRILV